MKDFMPTAQFRLEPGCQNTKYFRDAKRDVSFCCDWEFFKRARNHPRDRRITSNVLLPPAEPQLGDSCPLEHVHMFGREQNPSPQEFLQIAGGGKGHSD